MTRDEVLAWLEARVTHDDISGCLIWSLAVNQQGAPVATVDGKHSRAVRPWLYDHLADLTRIGAQRGRRKILPRCGDTRCMNLEHWMLLTPSAMNRHLAQTGRYGTAKRRIACVRSAALSSPYTDDQVAEARRLRSEGLTLKQVAEQVGAHFSSVSRWCQGGRRTTLTGASVFSLAPRR